MQSTSISRDERLDTGSEHFDVVFGRVPSSHPAHLVHRWIPIPEEAPVAERLNQLGCETGEKAVDLGCYANFDAVNRRHAPMEEQGHCICMSSKVDPEVVVECCVELGSEIPHLRRQLGDLLAGVLGAASHVWVEKHDGLGAEHAVLGAPKADDVDASIEGERPECFSGTAE